MTHWRQEFKDAVTFAIGPINNSTYQTFDRRVDHAFKVWSGRYTMNPEQDEYAWKILTHAVLKAARSCDGRDIKNAYVYRRKAVVNGLELIVNDPAVHQGFKRRATDLIDVKELLRDALFTT